MQISRQRQRIIAMLLTLAMVLSLSVTDVRAASGGNIKFKKYNYPTTVNLGNGFGIRGKIKAKKKISSVTIGIYDPKAKKYRVKYKKTGLNKRSFNIKTADPYVKFGKLKAGTYYYRIRVRLKGHKSVRILNKKFTVVNNKAETIKLGVPDSTGLKLKGVKAPGTYNVGKEFIPRGIVTSSSEIKKVEIGIVFEATNKWTQYKCTKKVNGKTFDISTVADKLEFDRLPGGTYMYRMYAHTEDGLRIAFNKEFTVIPSNKPRKAVKWAKRIAADDSFTYGKKPYANANGCYFCGTNNKKVRLARKGKVKNPKRYLKTYVCLTFVGAAYAHGAGDPEILSNCQRRRMTMYETNDNFKEFSCWMKIGRCRDLTVDDLQPGDVIVKWSDHNDNFGHICMYIGDNDLVEACGGNWSARSIGVRKNAAATRLAMYGASKKNYVMRYRY